MTAADVVYSLNHHRKPGSASGAKLLLASVINIKATSKYEVTITLSSDIADLPYVVAD